MPINDAALHALIIPGAKAAELSLGSNREKTITLLGKPDKESNNTDHTKIMEYKSVRVFIKNDKVIQIDLFDKYTGKTIDEMGLGTPITALKAHWGYELILSKTKDVWEYDTHPGIGFEFTNHQDPQPEDTITKICIYPH